MLELNKIIEGDCFEVLQSMPANSIDCVVTSPPYWGLRDYGNVNQIGLEDDYKVYLESLLVIFDEVKRVLKPEGTCWVNLGDTYNANCRAGSKDLTHKQATNPGSIAFMGRDNGKPEKCLLMIPARFAIAMTDRGWILRNEIVWHKPNPMPESVKDRCTKAHEMLYFFTKSKNYYFDADSIKTESKKPLDPRSEGRKREPTSMINGIRASGEYKLANKRDVWSIPVKPYKAAHFATYPPELIKPCIQAGSPRGGIVLDIFMGSGTTAEVARDLGRNYIGIELNPEYIKIANERLHQEKLVLL